jgi:hypothetical protein
MSEITLLNRTKDTELSPAVAAVRATLLKGLAAKEVFAEAIDKTVRSVDLYISQGMPVEYIGRTPYVQVEAARDWLRARRQRVMEPRGRGRPRKAA